MIKCSKPNTASSGYSSISSKHVHCCIHVWRDHVSREHSTAAVGFHFGGRPHKRNYCFVLRRWSWVGFTREAESPCPRVEGPTPQLATKRSLVPGVLFFFCWYQALAEHNTAAVGFHFGGRPHKRNYCFVLTSLLLGGLHQRSGVTLPTGGRADPAIGNEALAGTRRSVFFLGGGCSPIL